jgi:hypothetical protein
LKITGDGTKEAGTHAALTTRTYTQAYIDKEADKRKADAEPNQAKPSLPAPFARLCLIVRLGKNLA